MLKNAQFKFRKVLTLKKNSMIEEKSVLVHINVLCHI